MSRSTRWHGLLLLLTASLAAGCSSLFGPDANCRDRDNLTSCVDQDTYVRGETIFWEIQSSRRDTVFLDVCGTHLVRDVEGFEERYFPQLNCGSDVDRAEVIAMMIPILPGGVAGGEFVIGQLAAQGRYRLNLWVVDEGGHRLSVGPYFTPNFGIFLSR